MPTGLRERKKEATRRAIGDAALALAVEYGPDAVTVGQIAEAADVSERTFFNYFATKEESFFAVPPDRPREIVEEFHARPPEEPILTSLREVLVGSENLYHEQAERWSRRLELVRTHPSLLSAYVASYADIERRLIVAVAERIGTDPDRDVYPKLAVSAAVTAVRAALTHWQAPGDVRALAALFDEAFAYLEAGLALP